MRVRIMLLAVVGLLAGGLSAAPAQGAVTYQGTVAAAIELLPVAAENRTGYDRVLFPHWLDADGDCQNARQETLLSETLAPVTYTSTRNCTVSTGQWYSYFDARTFTAASQVSIDHMVALAEAWDSGASGWTLQMRKDFANDLGDPRSLTAVSISSNSSKSDSDPATWLPQYEKCRYLSDWVAVKLRWGLSVDDLELAALRSQSGGCGTQDLTVVIVNGGAPDTVAPTAPTGLTATASVGQVVLNWAAATDDVGVSQYRVNRDGNLLNSLTGRSYTDTAVTAGATYTYSVVAVDAAGNTSAPAIVSATVPAGGLAITGTTRIVNRNKYADLRWTGATTRVDLWRGSSRLLSNSTVSSHTNQVSRTTTTATYTVCPTGFSRTSPSCSSVTLTW